MNISIILIGVLILAVSLAFSFFIEWLQNKGAKDDKKKGPSEGTTKTIPENKKTSI